MISYIYLHLFKMQVSIAFLILTILFFFFYVLWVSFYVFKNIQYLFHGCKTFFYCFDCVVSNFFFFVLVSVFYVRWTFAVYI